MAPIYFLAPTLPATSSLYKTRNKTTSNTHNPRFHYYSQHSHTNCMLKICKETNPRSTMVVPLGPGKFYGSSLPRPRIYTDVKFNSDRVDPPVSVMDPFLSWANEAHWSMGGLNFKRLRLQGRIEGNVGKLRKEHEKVVKAENKQISKDATVKRGASSVSPPPAPVAVKRRRFLALSDEEEEEEHVEEEEIVEKKKESYRRKLVNEFDKVANEDFKGVKKTKTRGSKREGEAVVDEIKESTPKKIKKVKNSKSEIRSEAVVDEINASSPKKIKKVKNSKSEIRISPRLTRGGSK